MNDRLFLRELVEVTVEEEGFNIDGDVLINLADLTELSDEEVIEIIEEMGYRCEKKSASCDGEYWVSK